MDNNTDTPTNQTEEITFTESERKVIDAALNKQSASLVLLGILAARGYSLEKCSWEFMPMPGAKKVG